MAENYTKYFIELVTKANNGDQEAIKQIYLEYLDEKDYNLVYDQETIDFFKNHQDKPYSLFTLAKMTLLGAGVEKDIDQGCQYLEKSAELGCSEGYILLAELARNDLYTKETYEDLLEKGCQHGNPNGYYLRAMAAEENGDEEAFLEDMNISAEKGNSNAIDRIGQHYHDQENYAEAKKYYQRGIKLNNRHSYLNLGVMYREGEGCSSNLKKAIELMTKACELGNVRAMVCLGAIYSDQGEMEKAKKYLKQASQEGDQLAFYNLGLIYQDEDEKKLSVQMFLSAARLGHFESINKLIRMGIDPSTLDEDLDQVIKNQEQMNQMFKGFGAYD